MSELYIEHEDGEEFIVNHDLTNATLEAINHEAQIDNALEMFFAADGEISEIADVIPRRVGTSVNEDVLYRVNSANNLLDIIQTVGDIEAEKFTKPDPMSSSAFVAFTTQTSFVRYSLSAKKALSNLIALCDEMNVWTTDDTQTRYIFIFNDFWKEYRDITEEERQKYKQEFIID